MAKTSSKTSKTSGTPPWTPTKAWRTKMEAGGNGEEEVCGWCMEKRPNSHSSITPCNNIYTNAILPLKITKMLLLSH